MFSGQSTFVRFYRGSQRVSRAAGGLGRWVLIAPGLTLIFIGLAILIWPELLAYMVAGLFIAVGLMVAGWGWRLSANSRRSAAQWQFVDEYENRPRSTF